MIHLWGPQQTQWNRAYSFWIEPPIVLGWKGLWLVAPLHFHGHCDYQDLFDLPNPLVPLPLWLWMEHLGLRWVLSPWSPILAYGSSLAPSKLPTSELNSTRALIPCDALPSSLIDSNVSLKWNNKRVRSWGTFPSKQHFGGRGVCWSFRMGLGRMTSNSITHMGLHKNKQQVS
jgi:hypothetical protein